MEHKVVIRNMGGSYYVLIPKQVMSQLEWREGDVCNLRVRSEESDIIELENISAQLRKARRRGLLK